MHDELTDAEKYTKEMDEKWEKSFAESHDLLKMLGDEALAAHKLKQAKKIAKKLIKLRIEKFKLLKDQEDMS